MLSTDYAGTHGTNSSNSTSRCFQLITISVQLAGVYQWRMWRSVLQRVNACCVGRRLVGRHKMRREEERNERGGQERQREKQKRSKKTEESKRQRDRDREREKQSKREREGETEREREREREKHVYACV